MDNHHFKSLAKIRPRPKTTYCSQGRAVLATNNVFGYSDIVFAHLLGEVES